MLKMVRKSVQSANLLLAWWRQWVTNLFGSANLL